MTEFRFLSETFPLTLMWVTSEVKGEVYFTKSQASLALLFPLHLHNKSKTEKVRFKERMKRKRGVERKLPLL